MPIHAVTCTFPSLSSLDFIEFGFGTRESSAPAGVVTVHQVHSARVVSNRGLPPRADDARPDADALIENTPGVTIGVRTADCVPVLLADPVTRSVAAIHAGWKGTAAGIVPAAIRWMAREFETRAEDIRAAIGPSIGPCCYEVRPEVAKEFDVTTRHHVQLDLAAANARQLAQAGVLTENISISGDCTKCHPDIYHSFRRDREAAGRMISWIRIS
jgi:YfiH family protein